jgi:ssDNA-binding Zn-finger/Zn-ribbon topoisomerase 1
MDSIHFPNVVKMLETVQIKFANSKDESFLECLKSFLKANKYHPMLQIKKVFKSSSLILLHNTHKRTDVSHFKDLYDESRSVIIDVNKPIGENIVISLADKIPESITFEQYVEKALDTDAIEKAYEGTMIYIYNHEGQWFFGTSTIPDIDYSRFFHKTKTHGQMFDEAILDGREKFVERLSPDKEYGFLLVHYQNANIMNYTEEFGENYAKLFHIFSRSKTTKGAETDYLDELKESPVMYSPVLTREDCTETICNDQKTYGVIVRTAAGETFKVCRKEVFDKETKNRGNSNVWVNMTDVYMKGIPHYKVNDYIIEHLGGNKESLTMTDDMGRVYEPTYIIHEVMRNMCDAMYGMYRTSTYYNKYTGRFTIAKDIDSTFAPIIRFHLAQLRSIQITTHSHAPITPLAVRHYICLHQTMKHIRLLVAHFAKHYSSQEHSKNYKSTWCFVFLNTLLTN